MSTRHPAAAVLGNLAGAAFAGYLLLPHLSYFLATGRPLAGVFAVQQAWVGAVFLIRRPARCSSRRALDWVAAYAGWFTSFLIRPGGYALPGYAAAAGLWIQVAGLL